jgi:hypothetical protein
LTAVTRFQAGCAPVWNAGWSIKLDGPITAFGGDLKCHQASREDTMNSHVFVWTGRSDQRWTNNANRRVFEPARGKREAEYAGPNAEEANGFHQREAAEFDPEFVKKLAQRK